MIIQIQTDGYPAPIQVLNLVAMEYPFAQVEPYAFDVMSTNKFKVRVDAGEGWGQGFDAKNMEHRLNLILRKNLK